MCINRCDWCELNHLRSPSQAFRSSQGSTAVFTFFEGLSMKRIIAVVVALLGCVAMAQAQGPIQGQVVAGGCTGCGSAQVAGYGVASSGCTGCASAKFGLNPLFARLMFWKKDNGCGLGCGKLGGGLFGCNNCAGQGGYGHGGAGFNPYPNGVPGTLVFPNHQYIRSPRDWYMNER
jgi:hypothetical protein